jgi:hypothetical protein
MLIQSTLAEPAARRRLILNDPMGEAEGVYGTRRGRLEGQWGRLQSRADFGQGMPVIDAGMGD